MTEPRTSQLPKPLQQALHNASLAMHYGEPPNLVCGAKDSKYSYGRLLQDNRHLSILYLREFIEGATGGMRTVREFNARIGIPGVLVFQHIIIPLLVCDASRPEGIVSIARSSDVCYTLSGVRRASYGLTLRLRS